MSDVVIRVANLGKRYRIGQREPYLALRDVLARVLEAPIRWWRRQPSQPRNGHPDHIWALKGVSFQLTEGEAVGLIGRNAAGKTTLLKILGRITRPTEGWAEVRGRMGSLLEVGTGFHPELTGRENIFLNGAILGMKKQEIERKFDEIVAFAELEKFIDTPVKHYSSGMYVRLAFAVAAHLEPDILLVDEVLAVGDAAFQKKCLGKMGDVAHQGRTVVFVSHNMAAILNLCQRAILLEAGTIAAQGRVEAVVQKYLESLRVDVAQDLRGLKDRRGRGRVQFTRVQFEDDAGGPIARGISGQPLVIALDYRSEDRRALQNYRVSVAVYDSLGQLLFNCSSELVNAQPVPLPPVGRIKCVIPRLPLTQSQYLISPYLEVNREIEDWIPVAAVLDVVDGDFYGTGKLCPDGWQGKGVLVPHQWILNAES